MQQTTDPTARNLLAYLSALPRRFAAQQRLDSTSNRFLAEVALDLGNALLWIQPHVEGSVPHAEQPLSESAQTVWALGKQFRAVGMALWEPLPARSESTDVRRLVSVVEKLAESVEALQAERQFRAMRDAASGKDGAL